MASYRKLPSGNWQAIIRLPGGRRKARTFQRRSQAGRWAHETRSVAHLLAQTHPQVSVTWTTAGMEILIPDELITMDMAVELEHAIANIITRAG